jgi:hypothetical protein
VLALLHRNRSARLRLAGCLTLAILALGLGVPHPAAASEETWRYVTYGAGAATIYMAAKKKTVPAVVGAAGTYLAHQQWKKERDRRRERERFDRYERRTPYRPDRYDRSSREDCNDRNRDRDRHSTRLELPRRRDRDDDIFTRRDRDDDIFPRGERSRRSGEDAFPTRRRAGRYDTSRLPLPADLRLPLPLPGDPRR